MISTPRRRAAIRPFETRTAIRSTRGVLIPYPHTPPPTPASSESVVGLGIDSVADRKYDEAYERIKAKPTWTQTPPNSKPSLAGTARRVQPERNPPVRADTPRPTTPVQPQLLSELALWIITELETSFASVPQVNLRLESPVILQIYLQRRIPQKTPPTLPLSRHSNFNGPLSNHPTHCSSEFLRQAASPPVPPGLNTNITTRSLHVIFPHASSQLLSSLQATYLALHYISTIHPSSPSACSSPRSLDENFSPLSPNISYIPAKARAMLGLRAPTTRSRLPASWTRPEERGWEQRIEDLKCKLRSEAAKFVSLCEGSDLGNNEALVRAVGQVVRFGQEAHRPS